MKKLYISFPNPLFNNNFIYQESPKYPVSESESVEWEDFDAKTELQTKNELNNLKEELSENALKEELIATTLKQANDEWLIKFNTLSIGRQEDIVKNLRSKSSYWEGFYNGFIGSESPEYIEIKDEIDELKKGDYNRGYDKGKDIAMG